MELEREPSSLSQSSLWLFGLLGILSVSALLTSKRNQSGKSASPHDKAQVKGNFAPRGAIAVPEIPPSPACGHNTNERKDNTPPWKKWAEIAIALGTVGLLIVNLGQMRSTEKAATAAETANKNAQAALTISQQAYVTVGRQDGTVAEVIMPNKTTAKAAILVYFQNSGHLPAKFNWGSDSTLIALLPTDASAVREPYGSQWSEFDTDHAFAPMWRARNRKRPSSFGWSGTITIAGNSSHQGILWELPKERMLQLMNWDRPFNPGGKFEYCDGFGHRVCRRFSLRYAGKPYNRLFLISADECAQWEMQVLNPDPTFEYLNPCELEREELKGTFPNRPKP